MASLAFFQVVLHAAPDDKPQGEDGPAPPITANQTGRASSAVQSAAQTAGRENRANPTPTAAAAKI